MAGRRAAGAGRQAEPEKALLGDSDVIALDRRLAEAKRASGGKAALAVLLHGRPAAGRCSAGCAPAGVIDSVLCASVLGLLSVTVIGIDVGGRRKGFHAVALTAGRYAAQLLTPDPRQLADWCRAVIGARLIAIDAPCRWSTAGRARPCERELNAAGIRCFASPSRDAALRHPTDYYGWMLQGEALYRELEASHPRLAALPGPGQPSGAPACFETFPHAITWQLRGGQASAAHKRRQRTELLLQAGIDPAPLTSIDHVDAALCALVAHHLASGSPCRAFGEPDTGLIVVPQGPPAGMPPVPSGPTTPPAAATTA